MPSEQELKKAFAMFDRNGDGLLSVDELKAILCLPTPGRTPLSETKVEEILEKCDTNGDGQLSMEELAAGWADLSIGALLASAKAPPPSFAGLIAAGTVVPDEREGPYALGSYHANVTGGHRGYKTNEGRDEWHAANKAIMALQTSWATIDFEAENAVDPEYMFSFGAINDRGLAMHELRPSPAATRKGALALLGAEQVSKAQFVQRMSLEDDASWHEFVRLVTLWDSLQPEPEPEPEERGRRSLLHAREHAPAPNASGPGPEPSPAAAAAGRLRRRRGLSMKGPWSVTHDRFSFSDEQGTRLDGSGTPLPAVRLYCVVPLHDGVSQPEACVNATWLDGMPVDVKIVLPPRDDLGRGVQFAFFDTSSNEQSFSVRRRVGIDP